MKVWVVGATSGIGAETAALLDDEFNCDVHTSGLDADVTDRRLLARFFMEHGPFDGLIYCAGINHLDWSEDLDLDVMAKLHDVNVIGCLNVLQACKFTSPSSPLKRVVVVGSDAAWKPMRTSVAYNSSKAALHAMVQVIARERANEEFAINVVAPGLVNGTPMTEYVFEQTKKIRGWDDDALMSYMLAQIPMGRPAEPYEVAEVVCCVLLLETPYLNGAIIPVNGGR